MTICQCTIGLYDSPEHSRIFSETWPDEPSEESLFLFGNCIERTLCGRRFQVNCRSNCRLPFEDSVAGSRILTSAPVSSFDRSAVAPIHRLPRSSIFDHNGKAVRSGSWYWLSTYKPVQHRTVCGTLWIASISTILRHLATASPMAQPLQ
jgi:hypothetical protein